MVVSPYSTLFVSPQSSSILRPEAGNSADTAARLKTPQARNLEELNNESARPIFEISQSNESRNTFENALVYPRSDSVSLDQSIDNEDTQTPSFDRPDQFDKVQTFLQIQSFEDTPSLIDTFV